MKAKQAELIRKIKAAGEITSEELVDFLTSAGDLDEQIVTENNFSLLHLAVASRNIQAITVLIKNYARLINPVVGCGTALHLAANLNDVASITAIIDAAIPGQKTIHPDKTDDQIKQFITGVVDSEDKTPLMSAILEGHQDAIRLMLNNKAGGGYENKGVYHSIFGYAAQSKNPAACYEVFKDCYRDTILDLRDKTKKNCLDYALEHKNIESIEYLSRQSEVVNQVNLAKLIGVRDSSDHTSHDFDVAVSSAIERMTRTLGRTVELVDSSDRALAAAPSAEAKETGISSAGAKRTGYEREDTLIMDGVVTTVEMWGKANPDAARIADEDRAKKNEDREAEKLARNTGAGAREGLAEKIDRERAERAAASKSGKIVDFRDKLKKVPDFKGTGRG